MINRVRNTVLAIINKNNNGYITPDEFNLFATQAQLDIFEEYFSNYTIAIQKVNARVAGTGYADSLKRCEDVIDIFMVPSATLTFASGVFPIPQDVYKLERLNYNGRTNVDKISQQKANNLLSSDRTQPSKLFPCYSLAGYSATVYPSTIQSGITATYVRYPADPKWTYTVPNGSESPFFNPAANDYQDFELPLSDEMNLITRILQMSGISIREEEVVQAAKSEEVQDKQEQ